jgi:hypothetical protein
MELMNAPPLDQIASPLTRKPATAKDDPTPAVPGNTARNRGVTVTVPYPMLTP